MHQDGSSDHIWKMRHEVLYRCELSALYHQKRERFFEAADKAGKAVAVIGGSAALAKLAAPDALVWIAGAITVTSTLSLVLGFSERARRHAELARGFKQIEADIRRAGERNFDDVQVCDWAARVAVLEASEPPALGALVRVCQNELALARGEKEAIRPIRFHHRLLAHILDFSAA